MSKNDLDSVWHITSNTTDQEQYDFMMKKSHDAQECVQAYVDNDPMGHAVSLIELVKTGYTRDEIYSFLRILYRGV